MEDGLARDGVLTRCNQDRDATLTDVECANARRAAAAVALEVERARADRRNSGEQDVVASTVPAFGAPAGAVMPSTSPLFDVYAEGAEPFGRRSLEIEAAQPPANNFEIDSPKLVLTDLAVVPRPFRSDDVVQQ